MVRPRPVLVMLFAGLVLALNGPGENARAQALAFASPLHSTAPGKLHRIEADLARHVESWEGKADCRSTRRARAALKPAMARWLGAQMMERPSRRLARWGYHSGILWDEAQVFGGEARCRAGFRRVIAFADFR